MKVRGAKVFEVYIPSTSVNTREEKVCGVSPARLKKKKAAAAKRRQWFPVTDWGEGQQRHADCLKTENPPQTPKATAQHCLSNAATSLLVYLCRRRDCQEVSDM